MNQKETNKSFREILDKKKVDSKFEKHMGLFSSTVLGMGAIMGSGIYVLVGLAAEKAGPAIWLSFLFCGILAYFSVLLYSSMAKQISASGGGYLYAYKLLGPFWGFITGWSLAIGSIFGCSIYAMGFGIYISSAFFDSPSTFTFKVFAISLTLVLTILNLFVSKQAEKVQQTLAISNILVLVIFAFIAIPNVNTDNIFPVLGNGIGGIWGAISIIYLSFFGYQLIANNSEEVINAETVVPKAMNLSLLISLGIYMFVVLGSVLSVPWQEIASSSAPLAYIAGKNGGKFGIILITLGGILASAAALSSTLVSQSRQLFAMGKDYLLPKKMGKLNPKQGIPSFSLIIGSIGVTLALLFGDLESIAKAANFCFLASMLPISFALFKLQKFLISEGKKVSLFEKSVPYLSFLINIVLLLSTGLETLVLGNQILLVGAVVYFSYSRVREIRGKTGRSLVLVDEDSNLNFSWESNRKILVPMSNPESQSSLLNLCESLLSHYSDQNGDIYALSVIKTRNKTQDFNSALESSQDSALKTLETGASLISKSYLKYKPIVRVSHNLVKGVTDTARESKCNLIVMGFSERPKEKEATFMDKVLADTSSDMIFLRTRGDIFAPKKIAVALGSKSENIDLMVELASALSDSYSSEITFLSILGNSVDYKSYINAKSVLIKSIKQNTSRNTYQAKSLRSNEPLNTLIENSKNYDLIIAGTAKVRLLDSPKFGDFSLQLSKKASCSVALVYSSGINFKLIN